MAINPNKRVIESPKSNYTRKATMRNLYQSITLGTAMLAVGISAMAAGAPVANQFTPNSTISSSEVNNNFQELADRIDSAQTSDVIDFRDYANSGTDNWAREGLNQDGSQRNLLNETITISATQQDGTYTVTFEIRRAADNTLSYWSLSTQKSEPDGTYLLSHREILYGADGVTVGSDFTETPENIYLMRPHVMAIGNTFVNGATFTRQFAVKNGAASSEVTKVGFIRKYIISEKVANFGVYTDCIKIMRSDYGNRWQQHERSRVRCAGVGIVAEIRAHLDGRVDLRELMP